MAFSPHFCSISRESFLRKPLLKERKARFREPDTDVSVAGHTNRTSPFPHFYRLLLNLEGNP
jgi:hypothetical protein